MKTALFVIICIVIVALVLYLFLIMPRMLNRPDGTPFQGFLYAHRGLHDNATEAPENSIRAFMKAVDAGYGIELDVQLSKDKIPVVFHDFTLKRVCGVEGKVSDYTYEELQQFFLCNSDQKIPGFAEVLCMVDGKVPLIIEYKIPGGLTEVCPIADQLLQNYHGIYCIESFNPLGLIWYKKNQNSILRGQLADDFIKSGQKEFTKLLYFALHHLLFNFLTKPDFISYNHQRYKDISRQICRYLYGCLAVAWTIKSNKDLVDRKVDFDLFIFDSFIPGDNKEK
ncbi:MAG TPA: glycerophosphodiester phosphodiesterase family protein [Lachnospiraceae bacterium]|nr:glycerophosphodiester phosphodiesterase family protein [Lachnospiraceae bacterium]